MLIKKLSLLPLLVCLATFVCFPAMRLQAQALDRIIDDFESTGYGDWETTGKAFGDGPAAGTLPGQMHVSGFSGRYLVNSFVGGDASTGTLTSPNFRIDRDYLTFLIGGGGHQGKTCMNLLVDGQTVRTATGDNTQAGGNEELSLSFWDVSDLRGNEAQIQIVDQATGGWGHINVDRIVLSDKKPAIPQWARREKSFVVDKDYLLIPIQNGGKSSGRLRVSFDQQPTLDYGLAVATSAEQTDWYAFFSLQPFQGQQATISVDKVTEAGFQLIRQGDTIPGEEDFYREPHRPQFHFTQKVGWNNDPNGMVYHQGSWHLFFQHNPVALPWGNMTWGHATSPDLLHWTQQRSKLFPKTMAVGDCFSGGATVDKQNTAGWGKDTLVAFLTDTGAGESIAYSIDGGESFQWYTGNPVVKHQGRDPKVIWYQYDDRDQPLNAEAKKLGGHWVMIVYDESPEYGRNAAFYTSTDLKQWTEQSHLPGYFECTELFELPVDGDPNQTRWVVFAADAKYALGEFDGKVFTPQHEGKHQVHWGPYYASQTFDNAPNGRKIQIGWLRIDAPGPYNQHFSFPHQLTLHRTDAGVRMFANPVEEIKRLRQQTYTAPTQPLQQDQPVQLPAKSDLLDVILRVELGTAKKIELEVAGRKIVYDVAQYRLNEAPLNPVDNTIQIRVLADHSLTEIIGNEGRVYISGEGPAEQPKESIRVAVEAIGGDAELRAFEAHELKSIWHD